MEKQDYVRSLMDYPSVHEMVECERKEAEQAGYERGKQEGLEQGRIEILRKLLSDGLDAAVLAEASGLAESDILAMMAR